MEISLEQILGLAPDRFIAKSSRALAYTGKWDQLGRSDHYVWGDFPQINRSPLRAAVNLTGPSFYCSCRSRKSPCRHSLALLQIAVLHPDSFVDTSPPKWIKRWIKRTSRALNPISHPALYQGEDEERLHLLRSGMAELALWLEDLVRGGLSRAAERPKETWRRMADRLIDAQAGLIAKRINALFTLVSKSKDDHWPEPFLREIGTLYILTRGFANYDTLPTARQNDLRTAVGWLPKLFDAQTISDEWQVVGRSTSQIGRQYYYRTWLWGAATNRPALVLRATHNRLGGASLLTTGERFAGEMGFAASGYPLIAERSSNLSSESGKDAVAHGLTIREALDHFKRAQAANPWLAFYPLLLNGVWPEKVGGRWLIVDDTHTALPLDKSDKSHWHLLAVSGGQPITLFGEWDGHLFWPLSVRHWGRWIDCHALGGNIQ
ncbi:MAG: hypothetical protein QNJ45_12210 [Ardenticatenaceae bacterium]|nr:hypothetical protein [Ardenticatenaceae bacterium]